MEHSVDLKGQFFKDSFCEILHVHESQLLLGMPKTIASTMQHSCQVNLRIEHD